MRLLITDVTDMSPGNFCVAGWDIQNNVMVRPLPNGSNWTSALLGQYDVRPGILMDFAPAGRQHNGTYPHSTEDTVVNLTQIAVADRSAHDWLNTTSAARAETVQEAFDGNVQYNRVYRGQRQGIYVAQGTRRR